MMIQSLLKRSWTGCFSAILAGRRRADLMQKNFSSKWSWWAYVLLVLGVIILVFPLIWLLVVELTDYFHFNGGTSADHTAISTAIAALIAGIVTVFGVAI